MNYHILIFTILILNFFGAYSQTCDCSVLLIPKQVKIPLYKHSDKRSEVVNYLFNDTIKEDYVSARIDSVHSDLAFVKASGTVNDTMIKSGWIEFKFLGIYPSGYSEPLFLYSAPTDSSSIRFKIKVPEYDLYQVLNCQNKWLYIKHKAGDTLYEGWLNPDRQCSNPYTTCN